MDTDGTHWVVYKVDGNNLGGGGTCGNGNEEYSTPIMLQQLESDGITPTGSPIEILDRGSADGPLIEAPDLVLVDGVYVPLSRPWFTECLTITSVQLLFVLQQQLL